MHNLYLGLAILCEVIGTSTLKATHEFTRLWPSVVVVLGYGGAFYFLTLALRVIPVGVAYAIWSGLGIVLVTAAGAYFYRQIPDIAAIAGMGLIILGVVVLQVFSKSAVH